MLKPILWPPDMKNWLIGKDPDAGKDWRQEEKGMTEDETVGWHHQLNGHEFEQAPGVDDGQESLACCSPRGNEELDMTEQLNWTEKKSDKKIITGRPHFIALQILHFFNLFDLCLCVTFWSFSRYFKPFHTCYGDLWSVTFDVTAMPHWSLKWWLTFFINNFIFFGHPTWHPGS